MDNELEQAAVDELANMMLNMYTPLTKEDTSTG